MTQNAVIQATLLYDGLPELPEERLRTELRALAGRTNLPVSGATDMRDGMFRLMAEPYEITIQPTAAALPAATFSGALSANINAKLRRPLANVVAEHTAHVRIAVRDVTHAGSGPLSQAALRRITTFAQDVARLMLKLMPPMALHWHPTNLLTLPMGLAASDEGVLFLPLCLRLRNTSAVVPDTSQVNMAQAIEGSAALIGLPLHVMATSLNRFETLDLAIAFIRQLLDGESRPMPGTVFRDKKGTRVEVVDHKPCAEAPEGLLALVEMDQMEPKAVAAKITRSRETVAARVTTERLNRTRDLDAPLPPPRRRHSTLNEAQAQALQRGLDGIDAREAQAKEGPLPSRKELEKLRERTASQPRNQPGSR